MTRSTLESFSEHEKAGLTNLGDAAKEIGIANDTLRKYRSRNKETFPQPVLYGPGGMAIRWNRQEILDWWELYKKEIRKQKGTGQKHPSNRAKLGHKFKKVREANTCAECWKPFEYNQELWEMRTGDDLELLCVPCYEEQRGQNA